MYKYFNLIPLQEFDLAITNLLSQIEEKKQKISKMQTSITEDTELLEKKSALLKKIKVRLNNNELELEDLSQKYNTNNIKMQAAGVSPSIYEALSKESNNLKNQIDKIESLVLQDMEKIDILTKDIAKGTKVISGRNQHSTEVKDRTHKEIAELNKNLDILKTKRSQLSLQIETNTLEVYEELLRTKKSTVVFDIEDPSCPACGFFFPASFTNSIVTHDDCEKCPNCSVLLHWTGQRI